MIYHERKPETLDHLASLVQAFEAMWAVWMAKTDAMIEAYVEPGLPDDHPAVLAARAAGVELRKASDALRNAMWNSATGSVIYREILYQIVDGDELRQSKGIPMIRRTDISLLSDHVVRLDPLPE